jgi:hypothetical protein
MSVNEITFDERRTMATFHGARVAPVTDFIDPDDITQDDVLTDWEKDFLASIECWEGELTCPQQEKLDEIESEIPMRLELARQGRWPINR